MIQTLTGSNSFVLRDALRSITAEFTKSFGNFGLEQFRAGEVEYNRLLDAVQVLPFLADQRLVIIHEPSSNKQLAEHIEDFLAAVNEQTHLVLVETKFDKRSVLYKTLKKQTDFQEYTELDERQLATWITKEVKEQGGEITAADARYLVARIGSDQLRLSSEVAKLTSYQPAITRASIDLLTVQTPQSTIFELLDAAFSGNKKRMLQLYDEQRQQKVEPQAILALLVWQLHVLSVVKAAGDLSPSDIAAQAKMSPFVVRKSAALARNITLTELRTLVRRVLTIDVRLKREPLNADLAVRSLLFDL